MSASPASECLWLLFFPSSIHSTLLSAYCVLRHHHKLEMVLVSKEFITSWEKKVRNRRGAFFHQQIWIVCLLRVRLFWTWDKLVRKTAEIAALIDPLFYQEGTMNNKQTEEVYYQFSKGDYGK